MWRGMGRRFQIKFVAALVITLALGGSALWVMAIQRSTGQTPQQRPTVSPSEPYLLEWRRGDSALFQEAHIGKDGAGCEVVQASDLLYKACVLTTNLEPAVIASEAFGHLNSAPTPSLEALIWRGILSDDISVCPRAGLMDRYLDDCTRAVGAGRRTVTDQDLTVRVGDR